ncbi:MAG: hypothetical protein Q4A98_03825 [Comamonadaceae bacterium]|nr:hypothetical protein [Comamonadaceae bacterium]
MTYAKNFATNGKKIVSEIFGVWMEHRPASNTITIATFEVAR